MAVFDSAQRHARVDVLIPAYNAQATIVDAVASIQRQTVGDIRIIVVDDGSTDDTPRLLDAIARADDRVLVIAKPNGGIVEALNTALARVTAPFVVRHDADDIAFPDRFERQLDYLDRHPDCVAVGGNAWHIDAAGNRTGRTYFPEEVVPGPDAIPSKEPYLMHPFLAIRSADLIAVGGYRHVFHAEDTDLYWRLLDRGRLHNLAAMLGEYRIHDASVSSRSIHNGRVAAIYSQLAAISFLRRSRGQEDIGFPDADLARLSPDADLATLIDIAAQPLDERERTYLRIAVAGKMLELASYRPYHLERTDGRFISDALRRSYAMLRPTDRGMMRWHMADVVVRLASTGRWREMAALRPSWKVLAVLASRMVRGRRREGHRPI